MNTAGGRTNGKEGSHPRIHAAMITQVGSRYNSFIAPRNPRPSRGHKLVFDVGTTLLRLVRGRAGSGGRVGGCCSEKSWREPCPTPPSILTWRILSRNLFLVWPFLEANTEGISPRQLPRPTRWLTHDCHRAESRRR